MAINLEILSLRKKIQLTAAKIRIQLTLEGYSSIKIVNGKNSWCNHFQF